MVFIAKVQRVEHTYLQLVHKDTDVCVSDIVFTRIPFDPLLHFILEYHIMGGQKKDLIRISSQTITSIGGSFSQHFFFLLVFIIIQANVWPLFLWFGVSVK